MWFQTLQVVYSRGVRRYQLGMEGREGKMNKDCKCTLSMQSTVLMCTVQHKFLICRRVSNPNKVNFGPEVTFL